MISVTVEPSVVKTRFLDFILDASLICYQTSFSTLKLLVSLIFQYFESRPLLLVAKMWALLIGAVLLYALFDIIKTHFGTKPIAGGHHAEILLPHEESVELYHFALSSCSQKVRTCLHEAGIRFKSHHVSLPSSGSYETKMPSYLRVNPAGTVPVLVHDGHPVYESHDQIVYVENVLRDRSRPSLRPMDPDSIKRMEKWVESCSVIRSELMSDRNAAFRKRVGNLLPAITAPVFAANIVHLFTIKNVLASVIMLPFSNPKFFPLITIGFKLLGVQLMKSPLYAGIAKITVPNLARHLRLLEADLIEGGGPWICGNTFSLADISWIPIFERMEVARLWPVFTEGEAADGFKNVRELWNRIQNRSSYVNGRVPEFENKLNVIKGVIDAWKVEHPWFYNMFYDPKLALP